MIELISLLRLRHIVDQNRTEAARPLHPPKSTA
jgi:hypothetical protein